MISINTPGQCSPAKAPQDYNSSRSNKPNERSEIGDNDASLVEEIGDDVLVYPNPTNGKVTIVYSEKIKTIELYDLTGKLVYSQSNVMTKKVQFNLSNYERGMYSFRLITDGNMVNGKVIKE